jgi:hypothetical protein
MMWECISVMTTLMASPSVKAGCGLRGDILGLHGYLQRCLFSEGIADKFSNDAPDGPSPGAPAGASGQSNRKLLCELLELDNTNAPSPCAQDAAMDVNAAADIASPAPAVADVTGPLAAVDINAHASSSAAWACSSPLVATSGRRVGCYLFETHVQPASAVGAC